MASTVNIDIDQGSLFQYTFELQESLTSLINLSGATASASMLPEYDSPDTPTVFTASLTGSNVVISLSSGETAGLPAPNTFVYDVFVTDTSNNALMVVKGRARIHPQV
jgi:hypothetical protein